MPNKEDSWIPTSAENYDKRVKEERGLYYEHYHILLGRICDLLDIREDGHVLDIGCGTGNLSLLVARKKRYRVSGVDPSLAMLLQAARKATNERADNVNVICAARPFLHLPFRDGTFDGVITSLAFHHVKDVDKPAAVGEILRVTSPGGIVIIGDTMFETRKRMQQAMDKWKDELENEHFCIIEEIKSVFAGCGVSIVSEKISRVNWIVWGRKS